MRRIYRQCIQISFSATLVLLLLASVSLAQEATGPSYSGSMGSVTVGDQQFYRMSFRPDIPLGKLGLALDIELFIDDQGNVDAHGWEFGTSTEALDSFLRKLYYVRYGKSGDPVYLKVGALDNVTLGYGLIMSDYRNTLQYPGIKKTGLEFKLKDLGGTGLGLEGMINNFQDFQEGGALLGLRLSGRAVGKLELGLTYVVDLDQYGGLLDGDGDGFPDVIDAFPGDDERALDNDRDGVADELDSDDDNDGIVDVDPQSGLPNDVASSLIQLNATHGDAVFPVDQVVNRRQPFNKDRVSGDRFGILGLDAAYPVSQSDHLTVKLYGQMAILMDDDDQLNAAEADAQGVALGNRKAEGWGLAAPGLWLNTGPFNGQIEFRHFQKDFDSGYFDNLYELDRTRIDVATGRARTKDAQLGRDEQVSGVYGRLNADLGQFMLASASYQYLTGADDPKQQLVAGASLSKKMLENIPRLTRARAYYQKNNIGVRLNEKGTDEDGFFESTEDTFYGYDLGLEMASGVSIVWDTRYVFARGADLHLERQKIMTIETVFNF
jgi:hypothetical protein